jgi:multisubunit Na+/H+ antiporter MnhB subunit
MNYVAFQAAVWIAAGFVLVVLVIRRRKRRQHRKTE